MSVERSELKLDSKKSEDGPRPPLIEWPTSKLILFSILLPLAGAAILISAAILPIWSEDAPIRSVLIYSWMAIIGLWCVGFGFVTAGELKRRRRDPSADEEQQRAILREQALLAAETTASRDFRVGFLWFLGAAAVAMVLAGGKCITGQKFEWASAIGLPMAFSALYWMQTIKAGLGIWIARRKAPRSIKLSCLGLLVLIGLGWTIRSFALV